MAGGGFATSGGGEFEAKITPIVIISCIMAATGGLMFGYDVGVSGIIFFSYIFFPLHNIKFFYWKKVIELLVFLFNATITYLGTSICILYYLVERYNNARFKYIIYLI